MSIAKGFVLLAFAVIVATSSSNNVVLAQQNHQSRGAYPTDGLFAQQVTQTSGAIIDFRSPSEIQRYINNDPTNVEQALEKLFWQVYKTSNQNDTSQVANEINRQVGNNPESFTGDSIFWFGYRIASGQVKRVIQAIGHVTPPPTTNQSVGSYDDIAINDATYLADAAQRIFKGVQAVISGNTHPAGFKPSSYTTDIYNNSRFSYISDKRSDGQHLTIVVPSIALARTAPDLVNSGMQYGVYIKSPIYNPNSSNHYHFVQAIQKDQSLL